MSIRGALIGCGYISHRQLWAWQQIPAAEIVAVCDLDEAKARQRAREFGIPAVYTDYRQMLEEQRLDFVDIATRPETHLELVKAGAARGLHVLCQKPIADNLATAQAMTEACEAAGVTFMVNENVRFQAWFRKLRELLATGALGVPYNARFHNRWRSTLPDLRFEGQPYFAQMPRLLIFEAEIHVLDTARYLFGEAQSVYARTRRVSPHIVGEDKALILANFEQMTCLVDSNWYAVPEPGPQGVTWGTLVVEGTEATAVLQRDGRLTLYGQGEPQTWTFPADTIPQSFVAAQSHFLDCVQTGTEPETSGRQSLKTMALVFGAYRSAEAGQAVELD